jgi:amidase
VIHQQRIEANNHTGLQLRAVIDVAPYAKVIKIAQNLDEMRANGVS